MTSMDENSVDIRNKWHKSYWYQYLEYSSLCCRHHIPCLYVAEHLKDILFFTIFTRILISAILSFFIFLDIILFARFCIGRERKEKILHQCEMWKKCVQLFQLHQPKSFQVRSTSTSQRFFITSSLTPPLSTYMSSIFATGWKREKSSAFFFLFQL